MREPASSRAPVAALSVFLIVRDEEARLGRTLAAVRDLTDDLVVVDSGSLDATVALAEAAGARVFTHEFVGYGPQKRFAEDQCRHDWVLNIDADEVVPSAMADEIRQRLAERPASHDAYRLRIAEVFPGEGEPHSLAYALTPVRLYRRAMGRYSSSPVHDRVELVPGARVGRIKGTVHHFSVLSLGEQIAKLNAYTDRQVADMAARGRHVPTWRLLVEFPAAFIKAYILRRHFVRGVYGVMTAMNHAFFRWLRVAKDIERRRLQDHMERQADQRPDR